MKSHKNERTKVRSSLKICLEIVNPVLSRAARAVARRPLDELNVDALFFTLGSVLSEFIIGSFKVNIHWGLD